MPVNIHGKEYQTVAERVFQFRKENEGQLSIETEVLSAAELVQVKCSIRDKQGFVIATGHAEEVRGSTNINKTSALENCETSAAGRALAFFGLAGTEIASADEVSDAIIQQAKQDVADYFIHHNNTVSRCMNSILWIKESIAEGSFSVAKEAWNELSEDEQKTLWLAPSKGGIFTTEERKIMKSDEWGQA